MTTQPQRASDEAPAPHVAAITRACRTIEEADERPSLASLARAARMSAWHFHRVFKATTGVTPREYGHAVRAKRARAALAASRTVTEGLYAAGFGSSGRFYEASTAMLGMTPRQFRARGAATEIRVATAPCSLGVVLVAATAKGVCAILLGDDAAALRRDLAGRFSRAALVDGDRAFEDLVASVVALVEAPGRDPGLPLDVRGTAFQQRVWRALRAIPAGTTASYAEIARRIGAPTAARAVAGACAANPLAVAIPCHRVVRGDGDLGGYRWGLPRKRALLAREMSYK
jgi:AraC family transcriptional regulator of adaptative response/methylated-DNA-[protein]-cysteine methyltransferase